MSNKLIIKLDLIFFYKKKIIKQNLMFIYKIFKKLHLNLIEIIIIEFIKIEIRTIMI